MSVLETTNIMLRQYKFSKLPFSLHSFRTHRSKLTRSFTSKMHFKALAALLVTALSVSASPLDALEARQSCSSTYTVVGGDTCTTISGKTGVSVATIEADNPSINSGCTNLQIGQVLCLSGSSGTGPSGGINGIATYYDPNGGFGACGSILQNSDYVVALGPNDWAAGAHCGRAVTVQCRSVQVVVQDLCPGCQGDHGIDLTEPAMNTLDTNYVFDGHINVVWNFD
ncbi:hypothetical protein C8R45DRAFT_1139221 [Mycena sanguinolenta]|nr:hypothetical protein C8R45DRAFT_1139221 [Mycena sanguinolenta]